MCTDPSVSTVPVNPGETSWLEKLQCGYNLRGLIDPGYGWQLGRDRRLANKTLWMSRVGALKNAGALEVDAFGVTKMDGGGCVEADARMAVVVVVPAEEAPAKSAPIFNRAETIRELWPVFECLELRL